ncbi:MAG: methyltransferase domain-containing protein [Christensenellaceae bacterium]|jgi:SAM-dependent methyltransferase|nr:methyltransferase domain-containing protein [Christensenellaceae bacterium]
MDPIKSYYESYDEKGRLLLRYGQVEFLTTMHYIEKYLFPGAKILELGAGTGRYSHALAQMGYEVDALEYVEHNIELFRQATKPGERVTVRQGDARELVGFEDLSYDLCLILGPLYHVYTREDKLKILNEALRVTRPGGLLFAAHIIGDAALLELGFGKHLLDIADYIARGKIDPLSFATHSEPEEIFEMVRKEEIDALMAALPVTRLHYLMSDGLSRMIREALSAMSEEEFALYLRYHFAVCERQDMVGLSSHVLDVFKKNG